jgi:hypothetical protein
VQQVSNGPLHHELLQRAKRVAISQHGTLVLFTSHPKDGLVVNLCIPPLQAEEVLGPISIPRGSRHRPYPSPFLVSSPVAFKFLNVLVLNIAEKLIA